MQGSRGEIMGVFSAAPTGRSRGGMSGMPKRVRIRGSRAATVTTGQTMEGLGGETEEDMGRGAPDRRW
jgi:hypothetical protein